MSSSLCSLHYKHLEAFCYEDLALLCINCILHSGHKNHPFNSVDDAVIQEKNLYLSQLEQCQENKSRLISYLEELQEFQGQVQEVSDKQLIEITRFFNEIKKTVNEREQQLKIKVQETLQNEQQRIKHGQQDIQKFLYVLQNYQEEVVNVQTVDDNIKFLQNASKRHNILQSIQVSISTPELKVRFPEINKETETNFIIKSLLSMKLGSINSQSQLKPNLKCSQLQQGKKQQQQIRQSCKESNFKKSGTIQQQCKNAQCEKKQPLSESISQTNLPTNNQNQPKSVVSINLVKKLHNENRLPQNELIYNLLAKSGNNTKSFRLTNLHDARNFAREKSQERSCQEFPASEYKSTTPRKVAKSHSKNRNNTSDISPQIKYSDNQIKFKQYQYESFGQYSREMSENPLLGRSFQNEDSIKQEFGTFLNSHISEGQECSVNRNELSQLCQQLSYTFITLGGFVDCRSQLIERYEPKSEQSENYDILRNNRAKFAVSQLLNGNLLLMGGKQDGIRVNTCEEYQIRDKKLISSSIKLNGPRSGFGLISMNEFIYVVGGNDGSGSLDVMEVYNQVSQQWQKYPNMNECRDELAVVLGPDNNIYAIGGFGGISNTCLTSCERFNTQKKKWELIQPLSVPRRSLAAVSLPDGVYAIGGFNGTSYLSSVEKYDDQLGQWQLIAQLNQPRCTLSAISTPDSQFIYVFGGFDNGPLDKVEKYSVIKDQWEICPPMLAKRFMHQTIIVLR